MALSHLQGGHHLQLLPGGEAFFAALVQDIDRSQQEVRLETYIFNWDTSGERVANALARAARRGVAVYVVVDGAGTPQLAAPVQKLFEASGVQCRIYARLRGLGWLVPSRWRRLHRKLAVVDGQVAYCGGINVLDDFYDPNHGPLADPRFDFAVRVQGPLVRDVLEATAQFWWRLKAAKDVRELDIPSAWAALQSSARLQSEMRLGVGTDVEPQAGAAPAVPLPFRSSEHPAKAVLLLRDNLRRRAQIERAYLKAIGEARQQIIIANAYFVPGRRLRRALVHAARRGVRVRLLLQGRYEYFMQYHAARPVFGALLAAGVEIHEYAPSFLHAKVAVIDGIWATVGSSNLDPLSLLLAREANVVVQDMEFAQALQARLTLALEQQGKPLDPALFAARPRLQRGLDWLAFGLMRLMLFLSGNRY